MKDEIAARNGLAGTLYAVCIGYEGVMGMGRVIGDGGFYYDIVDIKVIPEHQKNSQDSICSRLYSCLGKFLK